MEFTVLSSLLNFIKELNTFNQQGCIKFIKSDIYRDIFNVTK